MFSGDSIELESDSSEVHDISIFSSAFDWRYLLLIVFTRVRYIVPRVEGYPIW